MNYPKTDARHWCPVCHGQRTSPIFDIDKCWICGGSGLARPDVAPTTEYKQEQQ